MSELVISAATIDEKPLALAIMLDAADRQAGYGMPAWTREDLSERIEWAQPLGALYVARLEGEPVAAFLLQWSDPLFWGERPDDAGYVHALAVSRSAAGRQVGQQILSWCEEQIRAADRSFLRLDTLAENPGLNRYYQELGFRHVGTLTPPNRYAANLYEKSVL